jgi:hypothetical protein
MRREIKHASCWRKTSPLSVLLIVSFFLVIQGQTLWAKPSATVRFLMNDSASMLDWGLFRIEYQLSPDSFGLKPKPRVIAQYEWNSNRILLQLTPDGESEFANAAEAEKWCQSVISMIKERLGINSKNGKPKTGDSSTLYTFFVHQGYETEGMPEDFGSKMDYLAEIIAQVPVKGPKGEKMSLRCKAPLLGREVSCTEARRR